MSAVDQITLQKHLEALAAAMKQIGEDSATLNQGDSSDAQRAKVGGALGATIGIMSQLFGVETVRAVIKDFVSGDVAERFWALQVKLAKSEKTDDPEPAPALSSSPP